MYLVFFQRAVCNPNIFLCWKLSTWRNVTFFLFRNFMVPIPSLVTAIPEAEFPLTLALKKCRMGGCPLLESWHLGRNPNNNGIAAYPLPKSRLAIYRISMCMELLRARGNRLAPQVFLFCCQVYYYSILFPDTRLPDLILVKFLSSVTDRPWHNSRWRRDRPIFILKWTRDGRTM